MIRKMLIVMMTLLPMVAMAQDNSWEQTQYDNGDAKYLEGAVPEVNGRVVFSTTINAPGKSAQQIYDLLKEDLTKMTKESNQLEQSRIAYENPETMQIIGSYQEWLVFKNKPLNLDRTRLLYNIVADCRNGEADIQMTRIVYIYDEERNMQTYKAEEWINDNYGLHKKKNKLARVSGKFRRKTIARKDYLFNRFTKLLQK
ncbi:MAG: DUF4468 domain-containing protein [Prevotella sp.]|nr:DUF4468 domain-containing protein [Prevotella sp.]